ncbi:hypothetical protein FQN60_000142, partial [Etheostoma spectabile]
MKFQTAYCVILMVWVVPIFISIPSAYMASETTYPHVEGRSYKTFCAQIWPVDQQVYYRSYFLLIFALEFMGPVTAMAVCYIQISRELWFKDVPGFQTEQIRKRLQRRRRTVIVLILVLVAYVLCWSPYYVFALLRDFYPTLISRDRNSLVAFYIIECIAMSNGVINTICFMSVRSNTKRLKKPGQFLLRLVTFVASKSVDDGDVRTSSLRVTEDAGGARLRWTQFVEILDSLEVLLIAVLGDGGGNVVRVLARGVAVVVDEAVVVPRVVVSVVRPGDGVCSACFMLLVSMATGPTCSSSSRMDTPFWVAVSAPPRRSPPPARLVSPAAVVGYPRRPRRPRQPLASLRLHRPRPSPRRRRQTRRSPPDSRVGLDGDVVRSSSLHFLLFFFFFGLSSSSSLSPAPSGEEVLGGGAGLAAAAPLALVDGA